MTAQKLEAAELFFTHSHRGTERDDAGSLLRCVSVRPGHPIRIVHPAPSEHNADGTNVGRVINGERLGAQDLRTQHFLGSKPARDLRALSGQGVRARRCRS